MISKILFRFLSTIRDLAVIDICLSHHLYITHFHFAVILWAGMTIETAVAENLRPVLEPLGDNSPSRIIIAGVHFITIWIEPGPGRSYGFPFNQPMEERDHCRNATTDNHDVALYSVKRRHQVVSLERGVA